MKQAKPKYMINSDGDPVPVKHVSTYEKKTEHKVQAIYKRWNKTRRALEKCMADCVADMAYLQDERVKLPGGKLGKKGNFSVSSFDGLVNIQIKQNYQISLDDRAKQARDLMFDYAEKQVAKMGEASGENFPFLMQLIEDTFRPNSIGALPYGKVLQLLRYDIKAVQWLKARALLVDSIKPQKGKAYLIVSEQVDRQHDAETIRLDAADCWPIETE